MQNPGSNGYGVAFGHNLSAAWAVMQIINNVTMLAIILAGGALVREREHGTIDHLLTMPLKPTEIVLAKVWTNSFVIVVAAGLSIRVVVEGLLRVPIGGSIALFLLGTAVYLFSATALGILLGTVARSMPQLGLLFMMVALPMNLLSGGNTQSKACRRRCSTSCSSFPPRTTSASPRRYSTAAPASTWFGAASPPSPVSVRSSLSRRCSGFGKRWC